MEVTAGATTRAYALFGLRAGFFSALHSAQIGADRSGEEGRGREGGGVQGDRGNRTSFSISVFLPSNSSRMSSNSRNLSESR